MVEFRQNGVPVAQHERSYARSQQILDLEHYLEVLEQKARSLARIEATGAVEGARPMAGEL